MKFIYSVACLVVFSLVSAPAQVLPVPSHPADGAKDQPTTVTLRWVPVLLATTYDVQLSTSPDFQSVIRNITDIGGTSVEVSGLGNSTTYHWRVRAIVLLVPGLWSSSSRFTTKEAPLQIPDAPTLSTPADGATDQSTTLSFAWNASSRAETYTLQVSSTESFSSLVVNRSSIQATSQQVDNLAFGKKYYWRVNAQNASGSSGWSAVRSFTTKPAVPSAPVLVSPANNATDQPTTVTLDWGDVAGASTYSLQVSAVTDFTSLVINEEASIAGSSREISGLSSATRYYWRVSAHNSAGSSPWSAAWSFTTRQAVPAAPTLLSPANGATGITSPVTFRWSAVPGATEYRLQVSVSNTFSSLFRDESSITTTSAAVEGFERNVAYYWRVNARNQSGGSGPWSEIRSFTTEALDTTLYYRLSTTIDFPTRANVSDYSPSDYRIVGLPGESNAPLAEFLPGVHRIDWQAYWDNGGSSNYWVEYDGSDIFRFSVGRAFWILKRGPWVIDEIVPVPKRNASREVEIALHQGWNLITDPYLRSIAWTRVQQRNSTFEPIYGFDGNRYGVATDLQPYAGYYFFNGDSLSTLFIPPEEPPSAPGGRGNASIVSARPAGAWSVQVHLNAGSFVDDALWFGSEPGASRHKDRQDVHKPRAFTVISTYFHRPEWNKEYNTFACDIRSPIQTSEQWDFSVSAAAKSDVALQFRGNEHIPRQFDAVLVDRQTGAITDLRTQNEYRFEALQGVSQFSIFVGTKEHLEEQVRSVSTVKQFALGANFPNPFNPTTTIPFEVPNESDLTVSIHDLLGRRIKVLVSERVRAGRHWALWDGRDEAGELVPSGVYFYRLEAEGGPAVGRAMVLTK